MERQSKYTMHTHIYISNVYFTCVFSVIHTGEFNLVLEGKQKKWVRCRQISLSNIWKKEISYFNWRKTVYHFDCCKFSLDWIYFLKRFWILASSLLLQSTWDLGWTVLFLPYCPSFYPYIYISTYIHIHILRPPISVSGSRSADTQWKCHYFFRTRGAKDLHSEQSPLCIIYWQFPNTTTLTIPCLANKIACRQGIDLVHSFLFPTATLFLFCYLIELIHKNRWSKDLGLYKHYLCA